MSSTTARRLPSGRRRTSRKTPRSSKRTWVGPEAGRTMLTLENVNVFYGGIHALRDVSLRVEAGEVVTLIGANGAGKSTTLRAITGLLAPRSGRIRFEGQDITGLPAHQLVARGISMAPEGRGIFRSEERRVGEEGRG